MNSTLPMLRQVRASRATQLVYCNGTIALARHKTCSCGVRLPWMVW